MWERSSAQIENSIEIYSHRESPVVVARISDVGAHDDPRAIHKAVNVAEFIDRIGDEFVAVLGFSQFTRPGRDVV